MKLLPSLDPAEEVQTVHPHHYPTTSPAVSQQLHLYNCFFDCPQRCWNVQTPTKFILQFLHSDWPAFNPRLLSVGGRARGRLPVLHVYPSSHIRVEVYLQLTLRSVVLYFHGTSLGYVSMSYIHTSIAGKLCLWAWTTRREARKWRV